MKLLPESLFIEEQDDGTYSIVGVIKRTEKPKIGLIEFPSISMEREEAEGLVELLKKGA